MNESFKTLQGISQSVEQLLSSESHSVNSREIRESAQNLQEAVQPCLQEFKSSALRLQILMQICLDEVKSAEDVWQSKQKIAQASTTQIWEQLGEITGHYVKIQEFGEKHKKSAIQEASRLWNERIAHLKTKHFIDSKNQLKKGVGWGEKDRFEKDIFSYLDVYSNHLDRIINTGVNVISEEISKIDLINFYTCLKLLDNDAYKRLETKIQSLQSKVIRGFTQESLHLSSRYLTTISTFFQPDLNIWKKRMGDVYWEEVVNFKKQVIKKAQERITVILDEKVALAKTTLDEGIAFYNDFLEKQARYQQETPEQRLIEKAWIEQQRQILTKVQTEIEAIANSD